MRLFFRKHFGALRPIDDAGEAAMQKVKNGGLVTVEMKRPRNIKLHAKYWVLCGIVAANTDIFQTSEEVSEFLKLATGHSRLIAVGADNYRVPKSIAFHAMDDTEFSAFWDRVCDVVINKIMPGLAKAEIEREVGEIIGIGATMDERRTA